MKYPLPVLGFAAFSGTGKTTLLEKLIPRLTNHGIRVGMIKHAHHEFDTDKPGKDSYRLRKAGAAQMLIASSRRIVLMTENDVPKEPRLEDLLQRLDSSGIDLVLVEGFKNVPFPRIELHRKELGHRLQYPNDADIIAVASDHLDDCGDLPALDINNSFAIAEFIIEWLQEKH